MGNALQYYNLSKSHSVFPPEELSVHFELSSYPFFLSSPSTEPTFTPLPLSLFAPTDRSPRHLLLPSTANFLSPPDNRLRRDYLSFESGEAEQIVKSWEKNQSLVDVFGKPGWVEPSSKPGEVTCFDNLYFASDKGDEVREAFEGKGESQCIEIETRRVVVSIKLTCSSLPLPSPRRFWSLVISWTACSLEL